MNENEERAFKLAFQFYQKWREVILETDGQWQEFADNVGRLSTDLDIEHNRLGWHLMEAVIETFNDLYRNGMKPMPANYFGRDDI